MPDDLKDPLEGLPAAPDLAGKGEETPEEVPPVETPEEAAVAAEEQTETEEKQAEPKPEEIEAQILAKIEKIMEIDPEAAAAYEEKLIREAQAAEEKPSEKKSVPDTATPVSEELIAADSKATFRRAEDAYEQAFASQEASCREIFTKIKALDAEIEADVTDLRKKPDADEDAIAVIIKQYRSQRSELEKAWEPLRSEYEKQSNYIRGLRTIKAELTDHPKFAQYPYQYALLRTNGKDGRPWIPDDMPVSQRLDVLNAFLDHVKGKKPEVKTPPKPKLSAAGAKAIHDLVTKIGGKKAGAGAAKPKATDVDPKVAAQHPSLQKDYW